MLLALWVDLIVSEKGKRRRALRRNINNAKSSQQNAYVMGKCSRRLSTDKSGVGGPDDVKILDEIQRHEAVPGASTVQFEDTPADAEVQSPF